MKRILNFFKKLSYRHYICLFITVSFLLISLFSFPYAFMRFGESARDFFVSIAYYFCDLFVGDANPIVPTVNEYSQTPITVPFNLPETWEEFQVAWSLYWQRFVTPENFYAYLSLIFNILYWTSYIAAMLLPVFLILALILRNQYTKQNNCYNQDTLPLRLWKRFSAKVKEPTVAWIKSFFAFLREEKKKKNGKYRRVRPWILIWILIWSFSFNLITVVVEAVAWYLYFCSSFDFLTLYRQVYKLLRDLLPMIDFVPIPVWAVLGIVIFDILRKKTGYQILAFLEACNRAFIKILSIVIIICGTMGKKKTTVLTDIGLSQEIMFRDEAFKRILENDLKFSNFPWVMLENELKRAFKYHEIYNLATVRKFIYKKRHRWLKSDKPREKIFDYDYKKYGLYYNNALYLEDVWEVLEKYSQLYFIYVIKSSLLISNYSVSVSNVLSDVGNFPLWNSDFFKRDSRLIEAFYRHSHIVDFDALRLGKLVLERNPLANSFDFGCILITEIGKERGNTLELQEKKKKDEGTNQKNDLFNSWLKMVRHSATVDYYPFVKVFTDDQRPESWGADARQLAQILHIQETEERRLAMPGFALEALIHDLLWLKFRSTYYDFRHNRGDNCLFMYAFHNLLGLIHGHYQRIYNTFGFSRVRIGVEDGRQDGVVKEHWYYLCDKKIYAKRFATDAFADFFTYKNISSAYGINDLPEFRTEKAGLDELAREHSYFVQDLLVGMLQNEI